MIPKIELYQGDCIKIMQNISEQSIDLILCDLPYGITASKWDSIIPFESLWGGYKRVKKDNTPVVLFCMMPFTASLVLSNKKEFKYIWTWYKRKTTGFLNAKKQPLRTIEHIAVFYKKQCVYNPQMRKGKYRFKGGYKKSLSCYGEIKPYNSTNDLYYPTDILEFPPPIQKGRVHPNQKPIELLEYLIKTYTNEGDTVLDNCMGSGSTGVACVNTNRNFIGVELDKQYYTIAKNRIKKAIDNLSQV